MRSAIRETWLSPARVPAGVAAQFVLRHSADAPSPPALLDEVRVHDDMLFVDAPANLSRANGPLLSLVLCLTTFAVFALTLLLYLGRLLYPPRPYWARSGAPVAPSPLRGEGQVHVLIACSRSFIGQTEPLQQEAFLPLLPPPVHPQRHIPVRR